MCSTQLLANFSARLCSECATTYDNELKGAILFSITKDSRLRCRHCALDEPTFANFCSLGKHYYTYHLEARNNPGRSAS